MAEDAGHGDVAIAPCWKVVCELVVLDIGVTPDAMLMVVSHLLRGGIYVTYCLQRATREMLGNSFGDSRFLCYAKNLGAWHCTS